MPDIQITDQLDKQIEPQKDLVLSQAATKPIQFQAAAAHVLQLGASQLGDAAPEIQIAPWRESVRFRPVSRPGRASGSHRPLKPRNLRRAYCARPADSLA